MKKGLEKIEGVARVDILFDEAPTIDGTPTPFQSVLQPGQYDIVHYHYPFVKTYWKHKLYIENARVLVCHWHGTDLRLTTFKNPLKNLYKPLQTALHKLMFEMADFHYYSTIDLSWWLRSLPRDKRSHIYQCIDTDIFKPLPTSVTKGIISLEKGSRGFETHKILHKDMPYKLSHYIRANIVPAEGLDQKLVQVSTLECLACGLFVNGHAGKDRRWVLDNASIPVVCSKTYDKYCELLSKKGDDD